VAAESEKQRVEQAQQLNAIVSAQHGLITRAQLRELSVSDGAVDDWIRAHRFVRLHRGIYRSSAAPETFEQKTLRAVLAAGDGAFASHVTAARLHGLDLKWARKNEFHVTVPFDRRPRGHFTEKLHRARTIDEKQLTTRKGIRCSQLPRLFAELSHTLPAKELDAAFESALRGSHNLEGWIRKSLPLLEAGQGPLTELRLLLDRQRSALLDNGLETDARRAFEAGKLPPWHEHCDVEDDAGGFLANVDFAWPAQRLAIELKGFHPRRGRSKFDRDSESERKLVAHGWAVVPITRTDLDKDPAKVAREVLAALKRRSATGGAAR
jgi:hypothetical protein